VSRPGQDLRFTLRSLAKQPGFTAAAILTLGLAIGANTAIFSIVDSVLLEPLPFRDPGRVVVIWAANPEAAKLFGSDDLPQSTANLVEFQQAATAFEGLALIQSDRLSLTGQGEPEQLGGVLVSADFFKVLGVPALIGRAPAGEQELAPGPPQSVMLSYNFWQRRFAGDPGVVGKSLLLNGRRLAVIGVMPPRFTFPLASEVPPYLGFGTTPDLWEPFALTAAQKRDRENRASLVFGRLKPGDSRAKAEQELRAISRRLGTLHPRSDRGWTAHLVPIADQMRRGFRPTLIVLWAAVAMVLLIACVNVASLLLARSASRQKEIALRTALGAGRSRLIAQLLTESLVLSLAGAGLGLILASGLLALCAHEIPAGMVGGATFTLDLRSLLFTLLLCLATTLLAGIFPSFQTTRPNLAGTLREGSRAGAGTSRGERIRRLLVATEMAGSVLVLIGAGLLLRSFERLMKVDPGFRTAGVLTFRLNLDPALPPDRLAAFYSRLDRELRSLPGVVSAGLISELPMSGMDNLTAVVLEGKPLPPGGQFQWVGSRTATPGYFDALGIKLIKGRKLRDSDVKGAPMAAVVDQAMIDAYWPGEEVLGRRFKRLDSHNSPWITVVGVVANLRQSDLYSEPRPTLFMTTDQTTLFYMPNQVFAAVRARGDPLALGPFVRQAVFATDRNQPLAQLGRLEDVVNRSIIKSRLSLVLLGLLAVLALALAVVGIYGVTSYSVAQKTHEIGIRMALGARPKAVLLRVIRETAALAGIGVIAGTALALMLNRLAAAYISALLYQVSASDPLTFAAVALTLGLVALLAAILPGQRAMRVSPIVALRTQ
jgi:predicted permease